ncbi:Flagella synthesis protein FlgN [Escherichia coli P12b]|nr:Flagella synthesis protein FlgN [Escherichia coli P12b]
MTRLAEILDQMSAVLNDLKTVMDQEQQHLSMGQINGSQLQWITETKKLTAGDAGLPRTVTQERTQYSK